MIKNYKFLSTFEFEGFEDIDVDTDVDIYA